MPGRDLETNNHILIIDTSNIKAFLKKIFDLWGGKKTTEKKKKHHTA